MMKRQVDDGAIWRILMLFTLLVAVLPGLAPLPHRFSQALRDSSKAYDYRVLPDAAQFAAQAAGYVPWRADLWEVAGTYALWADDLPGAIQYLEQAEQSGNDVFFPGKQSGGQRGLSAQGWQNLGDAYWLSGDHQAALHAWQMVLVRFGVSSALLDRLAQAHLAQGNYAAALENLQALVLVQPQDANLHYRLGLLLATRNPSLALEHLDTAATLDVQFSEMASAMRRAVLSARIGDDPAYTLLSAGRALAALGEWNYAAEAFHQATLTRPDYAEAWAYLGEARQQVAVGVPGSAASVEDDGLDALQKSLALAPDSLSARAFFSLYWMRRGQYDLAQEHLQVAIKLDPQNPALHVQLANTLAVAGDLARAYAAYQKAVDLAPGDPLYWRQLIEFSLDHDYSVREIALPMARQLLVAFPDEAANLTLMGRVMFELEDMANAERYLLWAKQADPNSALVYLLLGQVYMVQNNRQTAYQAFQQAASLGDGGPITLQAKRLMEAYSP